MNNASLLPGFQQIRASGPLIEEASPTAAIVLEAIKAGIRNGQYAPGQRLIEGELVTELGVGRSSVREALRMLAADGHVTLEHHRGARVRQYTREEVFNFQQVREVLEGLAASLAAQNSSLPEFRRDLLEIDAYADEAVETGHLANFVEANARFHDFILLKSGNPEIAAAIARGAHVYQLRLQRQQLFNRQEMAKAHCEHKAIITTMLGGAGADADVAMRAHIRSSRDWVLNAPDRFFRPGKSSL